MDWGLITAILIFIFGGIGATIGWIISRDNKKSNTINKLESEKISGHLGDLNSSLKRVHRRIDGVEASQSKMFDKLTDERDGAFVRLAKIETKLKMEDKNA